MLVKTLFLNPDCTVELWIHWLFNWWTFQVVKFAKTVHYNKEEEIITIKKAEGQKSVKLSLIFSPDISNNLFCT